MSVLMLQRLWMRQSHRHLAETHSFTLEHVVPEHHRTSIGLIAVVLRDVTSRSAWNALVYGHKQWFLTPPPFAVYSVEHPVSWAQNGMKSVARVLHCEQHTGDILFVPESWGHAVINMAESIGYASEFEFLAVL